MLNSISQLRVIFLIGIYLGLVLVSLFFGTEIVLVDPQGILGVDFQDFYDAAKLAQNDENPYQIARFVTPPISLIPSKILLAFDFSISALIWISANIFFIVSGLWLANRVMRLQNEFLLIVLFAALAFPTHMLLERGNIDGLIFWGLAICLFTTSSLVKSASFVIIIFSKIYPLILGPYLLLTVRKFWIYTFLIAGLFMILFHQEFFQYLPNFQTRVNYFRFSENISPHGLFAYFSELMKCNCFNIFYLYAIPYVILNLYLDLKIIQKDKRGHLQILVGSLSLIPMLFFPSVVYAYSGIILLIPMVVIDAFSSQFSKKIIFLFALLEALLMFPTVGYVKATGLEIFYGIPPLSLWIASLLVLTWKMKYYFYLKIKSPEN
jgi:hypothetical protein